LLHRLLAWLHRWAIAAAEAAASVPLVAGLRRAEGSSLLRGRLRLRSSCSYVLCHV
jgi:hypothetical protein